MAWILLALVIALVVYLYVQSYLIKITRYDITIPGLHPDLKGKKVVHLTDLHLRPRTNKSYIETIIDKTQNENPDMILVTGDLVQAGLETLSETPLRRFAELCSQTAPTYVVTGNHDIASGSFDEFKAIMKSSNVKLLLNQAVSVKNNSDEEALVIMGLSERVNRSTVPQPILKSIALTPSMEPLPKLLLVHRPEYFKHYGYDKTKSPALIFSGHTHAGQVILPFLGGVYAPGQGWFPKYDFGFFSDEEDRTKRMLVSRGLGNSSFPLRINNRPEIIVVTLT
ncbi:metallophosphoesterase [Alkalibacterium sp.]|nr:MAG: metallophosphoesterase [Alkalibacterium sp.]